MSNREESLAVLSVLKAISMQLAESESNAFAQLECEPEVAEDDRARYGRRVLVERKKSMVGGAEEEEEEEGDGQDMNITPARNDQKEIKW
jgi:hypothetical protein